LYTETDKRQRDQKVELGFGNIIGGSDALQYVLFRVQKVAPTDATVLILGETVTGKGMVAYGIHEMSVRKDKPMVTVNCAALPANLEHYMRSVSGSALLGAVDLLSETARFRIDKDAP
jgi:transcriptional regulator with GAF, ATPase, and Fis domain